MPPKRNNKSNNSKKRRPKPDQSSAVTPSSSPTKPVSSTSSTPAQQNDNKSTTATPNQPADLKLHNRPSKPSPTAANSAQNNHSDHQSAANNSDPSPFTERSVNIPEPNPSNHHSNSSNEPGPPNKANRDPKSKQSVTTQRSQDPDGRAEKSTLTSKSDSKKSNEKVINRSDANNHPQQDDAKIDSQDHQQQPAIPGTVDASQTQNGVSKIESTTGPDTTDHDHKSETVSGKSDQDPANRSLPNSGGKRPTKHVKFTHNLTRANHQSSGDNAKTDQVGEENHSRKQARNETTEEEEEDQSDLKAKPIRRQMSGSTDQFDFDAQQRLHAGPGGGMVKKPCHRRPESIDSPPDHPPSTSHEDPDDNNPHKDNLGFQHAKKSLHSIIDLQNRPDHPPINPDLIQIYLSYFDQDHDGLLTLMDTWRAFRGLGFGSISAVFATISLHLLLAPFLGIGSWIAPDLFGRCLIPLGRLRSETSGTSFIIDPHDLSVVDKNRHSSGRMGPLALWKKTQGHMGVAEMTDPIGWLKFVIGWIIAIGLTWPSDLSVKHELINGVYNGEILFLVAQDMRS
ncbi:hypothetical protein MJO29_013551 [Puccinia striiformis f. sp. tritici]|nr:hypothetical protein MJO29_013551 [Puccinia striiformis f. sp. tritici]